MLQRILSSLSHKTVFWDAGDSRFVYECASVHSYVLAGVSGSVHERTRVCACELARACLPACAYACTACVLLYMCTCLIACVPASVRAGTHVRMGGTGSRTPWKTPYDHLEAGKAFGVDR